MNEKRRHSISNNQKTSNGVLETIFQQESAFIHTQFSVDALHRALL